jgi:hypothetical protein
MAVIFEQFVEHVYSNDEHAGIIGIIWEDPDFPWKDLENMSEYVHALYGPRLSAEFDALLHYFDLSMTCSSSASDTTENEDWPVDSDTEEYLKWDTSTEQEV